MKTTEMEKKMNIRKCTRKNKRYYGFEQWKNVRAIYSRKVFNYPSTIHLQLSFREYNGGGGGGGGDQRSMSLQTFNKFIEFIHKYFTACIISMNDDSVYKRNLKKKKIIHSSLIASLFSSRFSFCQNLLLSIPKNRF